MDRWKDTPFEEILIESKDGEWGQGQETVGHRRAIVIRGTDFAEIDNPTKQFPERWIKENLVERKRLQPDDVLLETAGGTAAQSTGRSALLKESFFHRHGELPVLCASFSRYLRLDRKKYDSKFIYYLLQTLYRTGHMAVFNIQHTGVSRFQYTSFKRKTVLKVPLVEIQKKIAAVLSAYDDLIENNKRRITVLEKMAKEIYREWFVRMRFPGHEKVKVVKGVPEGWSKRSLSELGQYLNGYAFKPSDWHTDGIPIVKIKEMTSGVSQDTPRNTGETIHEKYHFDDEDIIFSWSATLLVKIWDQGQGLLNQHLFRVTPKSGIPKSFLYFSLKFSLDIFESLTTGATMKHIKRKELGFVKVNLPPEKLLCKFDKAVSGILRKKLTLTRANRLLMQLRDSLLPRLLSGKLSVEDLDIRFPPIMQ